MLMYPPYIGMMPKYHTGKPIQMNHTPIQIDIVLKLYIIIILGALKTANK